VTAAHRAVASNAFGLSLLLALAAAGLLAAGGATRSVGEHVVDGFEHRVAELRWLQDQGELDVTVARWTHTDVRPLVVALDRRSGALREQLSQVPAGFAEEDALRVADRVADDAAASSATGRDRLLMDIQGMAQDREALRTDGEALARDLQVAGAPEAAAEVRGALADLETEYTWTWDGFPATVGMRLDLLDTYARGVPPELIARVNAWGGDLAGVAGAWADVDARVDAYIADPAPAERRAAMTAAFREGVEAADSVAFSGRLLVYAGCVALGALVIRAVEGALARRRDLLAGDPSTAPAPVTYDPVALVLSHVEQGLVVVDEHGRLTSMRSAALDGWVAPERVGETPTVREWVGALDPAAGVRFGDAWASGDGALIEILAVDGGHVAVELRGARDGAPALLVVSDVSERMARGRAEAEVATLRRSLDALDQRGSGRRAA
jgi:hypothetical protein